MMKQKTTIKIHNNYFIHYSTGQLTLLSISSSQFAINRDNLF